MICAGDIPEVRATVLVAGGQRLAVRAERHRIDTFAAWIDDGIDQLAGSGFPQVSAAVPVTGSHHRGVRAERHRKDLRTAPAKHGGLASGASVPQIDITVLIAGPQRLAVT